MSFIDYEEMARITDKRIVKSRRSIFEALVNLLHDKSLSQITVTELCDHAVINRKTFYSQYDSVNAAFYDLQKNIILAFIGHMESNNIIGFRTFNAQEFILETDRIVESHVDSFNSLFPYLRSGDFYQILGEELGKTASRYCNRYGGDKDKSIYLPAMVFSVTGLLTSYFDWIHLGRVVPLENVVKMAKHVINQPLIDLLTKH